MHVSRNVLTAAHVVKNCPLKELQLWGSSNRAIGVKQVKVDERVDLALLLPAETMPGGLHVDGGDLKVGAFVSTWGFPAGYPGILPLLTVGYLAGASPTEPGGPVRLWVNGAFNSGNSGGPLVLVETGAAVGVVIAKLAPIPPTIESALQALENQASGFMYAAKLPNGQTKQFSEGQVIAAVLQYLRSQTQLVIGTAVPASDISMFLRSHGFEP